MKSTALTGLVISSLAASASLSRAVILLSQNFDTDPVNYTSTPFVIDTLDPARYFAPTNFPGIAPNPGVLGNATTYLAAQNMNNDGDGFSLVFDQFNPAFVNFDVNVTGYTDLTMSLDLAGMPTAEPENFLRLVTDQDGDGFYELMLFSFMGGGNSPYVDAVLGALTESFAPFTVTLPGPTAADGILRVRLEMFTDTNSQNEAQGVDNILITGVPEPGSAALAALAGLAFLRRSRR
jgi:hypothetical protein